jgi:aspartyl-tRNA(Asn)/glutamyl-tRNA(Gln) amidotransferase subunit A
MQRQREPVRSAPLIQHAVDEDVLWLSVRELGERIRKRQLSPVDLTAAYLARSQRLGPHLNAYATLLAEAAMDQAEAAERDLAAGRYRGPLHGIPYAAKDLLAVRGAPTGWGARPYDGQTFDADATVVRRLREAGAILLGKAAMIELAGGMGYRTAAASASGPARNPWNLECWTCGSSSGSGAVVAGGLAAFALGSETWGSILCPSAYTGSSGLRPTYGRVSRHGAMALSWSLDKLGPMARSADDCGLVLAALAGHDAQDPASLPEAEARFQWPPRATRRRPEPLRVGWLTNPWSRYGPGVEAAVQAAAAVLRHAGARVEDAQLPDGPWETAAVVIIQAEGAAAFQDLIASGRVADLADPLGRIGGYIAEQVPASDYVRAQRLRGVLQRRMENLFEPFDVLAAASLPVTATRLPDNLEEVLAFSDPLGGIGNLCGLPGISVPCGFGPDGLPVGIQFVGRALDDGAVLRAATLFQQHTDWHRRHPEVP